MEKLSKEIKQIILGVLIISSTAFFWWRLRVLFVSKQITWQYLLYSSLAYVFCLGFFLLLCLLSNNRRITYLASFLTSITFFIFFKFNYFYLIGIVFFNLLLILGYEMIKREQNDRIRARLKNFWKRGIPFIVIGFSLIISLVYYFNPLLKISQDKININPQVVGWIIKPFGGMFSKFIPFYDPDMTVDQLISSQSMLSGEQLRPSSLPPELLEIIDINQIKEMGVGDLLKDSQFGDLLKDQLGSSINKVDQSWLALQRNEFGKTLGIQLNGNEKMEDILVKIINSRMGEFIGPYASGISIGIAVTLFFVVRLASKFVIGLLAMIFAQILFWILEIIGFVKIEKVPKEAEVVLI